MVRKFESGEDGFGEKWADIKDNFTGKIFAINEIQKKNYVFSESICLRHKKAGIWLFPYFVLEPVK